MNFTDAVTVCFQKYVDFNGRARRPEYWYWTLFTVVLNILLSIVDFILFRSSIGVLATLGSLAVLLPGLAVTARRLHDIDRSGWWMLIVLIPLVGVIVLLVWLCTRGTAGANRFGPAPAR